MPVYEYRCRTCDATFEARRSMADADAGATCPDGHADVCRLLSVFAASRASQPARSGGCCGGSCACR